MIKDVEVMSCANFKANLPRLDSYPAVAAISCRQGKGHPVGDDYALAPDSPKFLSLFFDDCGPVKGDGIGYDNWEGQQPFTPEQAKQVLDFVEQLPEDTLLWVHCQAGISRSGAISSFIVDNFTEMNYQEWKQSNASWIQPNEYVYSLLRRELYKRKGIEVD